MKRTRWLDGVIAVAATTIVAAGGVSVASSPAAAATAATAATVNLSGDPNFDSDSIADFSTSQADWLSAPGSRYTMNPHGNQGAIDSNLSLRAGAYYGDPVDLGTIMKTQVAAVGGTAASAATTASTWYPYKLNYSATYASPAGTTVQGADYFTDPNTMVRELAVTNSSPVNVTISGTVPSGESATWNAASNALVIGGSTWGYAISFAQGSTAANPQASTTTPLNEIPTINGNTWTLVKRFDNNGFLDIGIGFSVSPDPGSVAVTRSQQPFKSSVASQIASAKSQTDQILRTVPAPQTYGIQGVNAVGTSGGAVTPGTQKANYYRAWTFFIQQTEAAFADTPAQGYSFPQVACGKASLINDFGSYAPLASSCPWDSLFAMQALAFLPSQAPTAFSALQGMLSKIIQNGNFTGEALPPRMAETAWVLYKHTNDLNTLTALYPSLKVYEQYMEQNPHWNYGDPADEKDLEYVGSSVHDEKIMENIAATVGQNADASYWQQHEASQISNMRTWFFANPNTVHRWYYTSTGSNYGNRTAEDPEGTLAALNVPGLPSDMRTQLKTYFLTIFDSTYGAEGLPTDKYPDISMTARGLIGDSNPFAYQWINSALRDAVYPNQFAETTNPGNGLSVPGGVTPSDFSAATVVDLTLLQNNFDMTNGVGAATNVSPADTSFYSGLEPGDTPVSSSVGRTDPAGGSSGVSGICCGLTGAQTTVSSGGRRSGSNALLYSGNASGTGHVYAYTKAFDFTSNPIPVTQSTVLSYSIYPQTSATTSSPVVGNNSTYTAIDVVFTDGTVLRNLGAIDQRGNTLSPQGQGGHLATDTWNRVISSIGSVAAGKSIARIGIGYDNPSSPNGGYRGFIDDISVADGA